MASYFIFSRHSHGLIVAAIVLTLRFCMCHIGPPPFEFAESFTSVMNTIVRVTLITGTGAFSGAGTAAPSPAL